MEFHTHETIYEYAKRCGPKFKRYGMEEFYKQDIGLAAKTSPVTGGSDAKTATWIMNSIGERDWWRECRPYFKLWPSIIPALLKTRLDATPDALSLRARPPILIRTAVGNEIMKDTIAITTILFYIAPVTLERILTLAIFPHMRKYPDTIFTIPLNDSTKTVEDLIGPIDPSLYTEGTCDLIPMKREIGSEDARLGILAVTKLAIAITLLANDPEFIQPDVLVADRRRFDESTDPEERQRLIDKARKRGIVGWRIGEAYETIPHYRRPHFGLRHTGKGRTVPRIVPIKGSIVHRDTMTKVPTGHFDDAGNEIEE